MKKNVGSISRYRVQESYFDTSDQPGTQHWHQAGHYYDGLELSIAPVTEEDPRTKREIAFHAGYGSLLGYDISGSGQPAQNDDEALAFYRYVMNGARGAAFLAGSRLILLRWLQLPDHSWQDNRVGIKTGISYTGGKMLAQTEFNGWVEDYEVYTVDPKSLLIVAGKLQFTIVGNDPRKYAAQLAAADSVILS